MPCISATHGYLFIQAVLNLPLSDTQLGSLDIQKLGPASEATTMATRTYHHERWTEEDDKLLRAMSEAGRSLTLMTVKLKRPMLSIKARAEVGVNIPGTGIGLRRKTLKQPAT